MSCSGRAHSLVHSWSNICYLRFQNAVLDNHPCRVVSNSYQKILHCHGRGREFESRRPHHSFQRLTRTEWLPRCTIVAQNEKGGRISPAPKCFLTRLVDQTVRCGVDRFAYIGQDAGGLDVMAVSHFSRVAQSLARGLATGFPAYNGRVEPS